MKAQSYTTVEVARLLKISPRTLYRWLYEGAVKEPKHINVGGAVIRLWTTQDVQRAKKVMRERTSTVRRVVENLPAIRAKARDAALSRMLQNTSSSHSAGYHAFITTQDELLTVDQLAERLQVKPTWVFEQTRTRAGDRSQDPLPHTKMGKYLRFSWPDIVEWLNRRNKGGQTSARR